MELFNGSDATKGQLDAVRVVRDRHSGMGKGIAFVEFTSQVRLLGLPCSCWRGGAGANPRGTL